MTPAADVSRTIRLTPRDRLARTPDEELVARAPWLFRLGTGLVLSLPRSSRTRRLLFSFFTVRTMMCFTRGDAQLLLTRCSPDCRIRIMERPDDLTLDESYEGHDGVRRLLGHVRSQLSNPRWIPRERIELRDGRFLHLSLIVSGPRVIPFAQRLEFRRGQMVDELLWIGSHPDVAAAQKE